MVVEIAVGVRREDFLRDVGNMLDGRQLGAKQFCSLAQMMIQVLVSKAVN
jgi:hypothetical protein